MELPSVVRSVVQWLRSGYPEGLPVRDYVPLFALLARRLSDHEVAQVADELVRVGDVGSPTALREAIVAVSFELPSDHDMARVSDRLAGLGWPGKLFDRSATADTDSGDRRPGQHTPGAADAEPKSDPSGK